MHPLTYKIRWNRDRHTYEVMADLVVVAAFSKYSEAEAWCLSDDVLDLTVEERVTR